MMIQTRSNFWLMARTVSKNDEFCITNEELCIKTEEFFIQNDELCRQSSLTRITLTACAGGAKTPKLSRKKSSFRSTLGLFWLKTTSLSGHHSRFGTTMHVQLIQPVNKGPF